MGTYMDNLSLPVLGVLDQGRGHRVRDGESQALGDRLLGHRIQRLAPPSDSAQHRSSPGLPAKGKAYRCRLFGKQRHFSGINGASLLVCVARASLYMCMSVDAVWGETHVLPDDRALPRAQKETTDDVAHA